MKRKPGTAGTAELLELLLRKKLTIQDVRVYQALEAFVAKHRRPPAIVELARKGGFSSHSRIHPSVKRLSALGLVTSGGRADPGLHLIGAVGRPASPAPPKRSVAAPVRRARNEEEDPRLSPVAEALCCATCAHWRPVHIGRHGCIANSHLRAGRTACLCCQFYTRRK